MYRLHVSGIQESASDYSHIVVYTYTKQLTQAFNGKDALNSTI